MLTHKKDHSTNWDKWYFFFYSGHHSKNKKHTQFQSNIDKFKLVPDPTYAITKLLLQESKAIR